MEVSSPLQTPNEQITNNEMMEYFRACQASEIQKIEQLWSKLTNELKRDGIYEACYWNQLGTLKYLISHGVDANSISPNGWNALYYAARKNHCEIIKFLVTEGGANINILTNLYKWTPLHCAARYGSVKTVHTLVSLGANLKIVDETNRTAIKIAQESKQTETVNYLQQSMARLFGIKFVLRLCRLLGRCKVRDPFVKCLILKCLVSELMGPYFTPKQIDTFISESTVKESLSQFRNIPNVVQNLISTCL